jgi:hypothetical protein
MHLGGRYLTDTDPIKSTRNQKTENGISAFLASFVFTYTDTVLRLATNIGN